MLFGILIITLGTIIMALIVIVVCYPSLIGNSLKRIFNNTKNQQSPNANLKIKKYSPEDILQAKITALVPGQTLLFKINPKWGANFAIVEMNMSSPQNGKKYLLGMQDNANLTDGKKEYIFDSDDALSIAKSIITREGVLFVPSDFKPEAGKQFSINSDTGKKLAEMRQ
jgi:hypothetical protein